MRVQQTQSNKCQAAWMPARTLIVGAWNAMAVYNLLELILYVDTAVDSKTYTEKLTHEKQVGIECNLFSSRRTGYLENANMKQTKKQ